MNKTFLSSLAATGVLVGLSVFSGNVSAQTVEHTPWQVLEGDKIETISTRPTTPDKQAEALRAVFDAFSKQLPKIDASGWKPAEVTNGVINYAFKKPIKCAQQVDFVYFQTEVDIPQEYKVTDFAVSYSDANDAARVYFFNDANPVGKFNADADLILRVSANQQVNLKDDLVPGKNRIVIAAFNQCAGGHVKGISLSINNQEVAEKPSAGGNDCFMLKAPTVDGVAATTAHYLSYFTKNLEADGRAPVRVLDPKASSEYMPLHLHMVPVGTGMSALKSTNYPKPKGVDETGKQPLLISADNGQMWIEYRANEKADRAYMTQIMPLGSGGSGKNVSFESKWDKTNGWYLRNQKSYGKLHPTSNPEYNKEDATWIMEPCAQ